MDLMGIFGLTKSPHQDCTCLYHVNLDKKNVDLRVNVVAENGEFTCKFVNFGCREGKFHAFWEQICQVLS